MTVRPSTKYTKGEGEQAEHLHAPVTHHHDHYHVSHHRGGTLIGEWDHRTYWHTHDHNHSELTHSHDYDGADEEEHHDREAHIHDHAAPTKSPA